MTNLKKDIDKCWGCGGTIDRKAEVRFRWYPSVYTTVWVGVERDLDSKTRDLRLAIKEELKK